MWTDVLLICWTKETINKTLEHTDRLSNARQDRRWLHQTLHTRPVKPTEAERKEFCLLTRLGDNPRTLGTSEAAASAKVRYLRALLATERHRAREAQGKEETEPLEDWWSSDGTSNWVGGVWTNPGASNTQEEEEDEAMQDDTESARETQLETEEDEEPDHKAKEPKRVSGWAVLNG